MQLFKKPVHYLTLTKIKCIWGNYIYIEVIQLTSTSEIYKTNTYHNDCYLRLLYLFSNFIWITLLFWNKRLPLLNAMLKQRHPLKLWN